MYRLISILAQHPWWLVLAIAGLLAILYVAAATGLDWWATREAQRQDDERKRLDRLMKACGDSKPWPTPPGPHGFARKRGRAA